MKAEMKICRECGAEFKAERFKNECSDVCRDKRQDRQGAQREAREQGAEDFKKDISISTFQSGQQEPSESKLLRPTQTDAEREMLKAYAQGQEDGRHQETCLFRFMKEARILKDVRTGGIVAVKLEHNEPSEQYDGEYYEDYWRVEEISERTIKRFMERERKVVAEFESVLTEATK